MDNEYTPPQSSMAANPTRRIPMPANPRFAFGAHIALLIPNAAIVFFLIPKFATTFSEILGGEPLPLLTAYIFSISYFLVHNGWLVIPVFIAFDWMVLFHGERFAPQPLIALWWWLILALLIAHPFAILIAVLLPLVRLTEQIGG